MKPIARKYTAPQQYEALRGSPLIQYCKGGLRVGAFSVECTVRPTSISREYRLRITYARNGAPMVFVLKPDLPELANNRSLPHVYSEQPTRLCLYLPGAQEWSDGQLIARTILPWAILWLYYFEHWLATDQWEGGGEHPLNKSEKITKKRKI